MTASGAGRLRWLDALRGLAVLAVVFEHACDYLAPELKHATRHVAHAGIFGVTLFFLVSGYIVPASIERRGDVRRFWIGRLFRLYPAFLAVFAVAALLSVWRPGMVPRALREHTGTTVLSHLTMLQDMLGGVNVQQQFWTLTYEMLFYLLVTAAFVVRVHRFSAEIAMVLAAVAVVVGGVLPSGRFAGDPLALRNLTVVAAAVLVVGVVAVCRRHVAGAVLLAALVFGLLAVNQPGGPWEGFVILAVMFTGTALYRAEQGQIAVGRAVLAVGTVLGAAVFAVHRYGGIWDMVGMTEPLARSSWLSAVVLALIVFGLGMASQRRRVPRWLSWLGTVSYSVYLTHVLVLRLLGDHLVQARAAGIPARLGWAAGCLGVTLVVSGLCHRLIELPFQALGRRFTDGPKLHELSDMPRPDREFSGPPRSGSAGRSSP
ncbi:acyltransferase family protein [Actinoplanes cyaneus]|uniref:acyltransferase family protein n=1 Tax=Actinoplanes cyaneus TaxID=52696 RepID=UPI001942B022|nr:acyltransferase [Actinoplanes cyaneus]